MSLDVTYANISQEEADRLGRASVMPVDADIAGNAIVFHEPGSTEPWVSRLVGDFVVATGARTVLETGCFMGATSLYILDALKRLGGGWFYGCEVDLPRQEAVRRRAEIIAPPDGLNTIGQADVVGVNLYGDVIKFLQSCNSIRFDLAWVDDNHEKAHVTKELTLLYPKMNKGGLILLHDVHGSCDLQSVVRNFGGYSISLPRLGPAGGLGIIEVAQ